MTQYGKDSPIQYKADDSPLTLADKASHEVIVGCLKELTPDLPILSEESPDAETVTAYRLRWREAAPELIKKICTN